MATLVSIFMRSLRQLRDSRNLGQLKTAKRYADLFVAEAGRRGYKGTGFVKAIQSVYEAERRRLA